MTPGSPDGTVSRRLATPCRGFVYVQSQSTHSITASARFSGGMTVISLFERSMLARQARQLAVSSGIKRPVADIVHRCNARQKGGRKRMASWMKHVLGLLIPVAVATGLMASAPKQDAPDWIISVSARCAVVAIVYCNVVFARWMAARQNHSIIALSLFVGGSVAMLGGWAYENAMLAAFGGLVNVAVGVFLTGAFGRWANELKPPHD